MKKIIIYNSGGGLGDSIQLFSLILSLKKHFKNSKFFYLGAHENHFENKLKEFNINIETINLDIKYFGFRWRQLFVIKNKFFKLGLGTIDLIIDLQSKLRNTIILKTIPHSNFYSTTFKFKFCTKKANYASKNHLINLSKFIDKKIEKVNFNTSDLSNIYLDEAKKLLPNSNYIGLSMTQGNLYRKKEWSIKNFVELANKLKYKNKTPVFFIEKDKIELINRIKSSVPNAIFPELYSNKSCPALVTALATRLDLGISIDNGVMHMMSLANIPMIVLFGPTDSEKFSPDGESITIIDSKKIYNSKDINTINVNEVLKLI